MRRAVDRRKVNEVPFFVATYQEAWPNHVHQLLAAIRGSFAARAVQPGRRNTRVFQRLNEQTRLLAIAEWESQAAYEALQQSQQPEQVGPTCGPPPTIEYLERLHLFHRMKQRAAVVACTTVEAPPERFVEVEAFLRGPAQREVVATASVVTRELYRSMETGRRLLAVTSWSAIADLEQFRATSAQRLEHELTALGATLSRFTGEIAAEYSLHDRAAEG